MKNSKKPKEKPPQTNEMTGKKEEDPNNELAEGGNDTPEKMSIKDEKLNENFSEKEENDYGGLPDTGNFKKFMGCGG
ncbi:MAG: hypothetical protein WBB45_16880 [Cyclobacteriaceae bacterium]